MRESTFKKSLQRELETVKAAIDDLVRQEKPPKVIKIPVCKKCAYYEYCFI